MVATRSRNFQLGLILATAFAVLVPTAAETYTPEGQQACTGDAFLQRRDSERRPRQGLPAQEQGAA
jgi:hypothetical protein